MAAGGGEELARVCLSPNSLSCPGHRLMSVEEELKKDHAEMQASVDSKQKIIDAQVGQPRGPCPPLPLSGPAPVRLCTCCAGLCRLPGRGAGASPPTTLRLPSPPLLQEKRIASLDAANARLMSALTQLKERYSTQTRNGISPTNPTKLQITENGEFRNSSNC